MYISEIMASYSALIGYGMGIALFFGVAIYLISKILENPELQAKGKEYIMTTLEGGGIIVLLLLVDFIIKEVMTVLLCESCSPYLMAKLALERVMDLITSVYFSLYLFDVIVGPFIQSSLTTPTLKIGIFSASMEFLPLAGLDVIMELYYILTNYTFDITLIALGRMAIVELAPAIGVFLLPLGIILRFLPSTKRTGGAIIALVLSFIYVFPLSILFSDYLIYEVGGVYSPGIGDPTLGDFEITGKDLNSLPTTREKGEEISKITPPKEAISPEQLAESASGRALKELEGELIGVLLISGINGIGALISWVGAGGAFSPQLRSLYVTGIVIQVISSSLLVSLLNPFKWNLIIISALFIYISLLAKVLVITIITFVLEIIITITFFRAFSSFLGGDSSLLGLTRLV